MNNEIKGIDFLSQYSSKGTVQVYKQVIKKFLKTVVHKEVERGQLEQVAIDYFRGKRNYEEDVSEFFVAIKISPPKTRQYSLSIVKTFLLENHVEFEQAFWRGLRRKVKGSHAITEDRVPNNAELRRIMTHLPIQGKALFLTLSSSGMRIGEALKLQVEDVEFEKDPVVVKIRAEHTKSGDNRIVFLSSEAKEVLLEWLKVKNKYVDSSVAKSALHIKEANYNAIFPFTFSTAQSLWHKACDKAGLGEKDKTTGMRLIHIHVLRKFYRTQLAQAIPVDVVEALMGHASYLSDAYRRYSLEQLAKFYKQGEQVLSIYGSDVHAIQEEVKDLENKMKTSADVIERREYVIEGLVENGKAKDKQITSLAEQLKKMQQLSFVHNHILANIIEQLPKEKQENLKELYAVLKKEKELKQ
jgi:integrase